LAGCYHRVTAMQMLRLRRAVCHSVRPNARQHEFPRVNVQLHVWLLCGAGAAAAGAGAADGGLPRIPLADVVVGPRLSAEGANGVVHGGVYRARSLHGVALAELALPEALKMRPVWEVHEALRGFVGT
jgi:hypothetical protein